MSSAAPAAITWLRYLDVTSPPAAALGMTPEPAPSEDLPGPDPYASAGVPEHEVQDRISAACLAERLSTEERLRDEHALQQAALKQGIAAALQSFADERSTYFTRVESEIVHLTLAIARKVLEREARLDPLLLAGLVRVALDGVQSGPGVRLRVPPAQVSLWQSHPVASTARHRLDVLADPSLDGEECVLETDIGSARLSFDTQMKEIERGFLDLLGQRPDRPAPLAHSTQAGPERLA